jgi:pimeloyl-ACP methyl ester carboxylesterase
MNLAVAGQSAFAYTAAHDYDPAKRTVVFVHGAGLDHSCWGLQSRYFGYHGYNVLAVDLPAHGRSGGAALKSVGEMADWVAQLLKEKGIKRASMVGHSMGSLIVLEFAARHPEVAEKIALIGTAYPMKVTDVFLDAAKRNDHAAYDMETIWGHSAVAPFSGNPNPGMWMYGDSLARLERLGPGVLHTDLSACNTYACGLEAAGKVKCPVLFVLGARDIMTPPKGAQELIKAIPGAQTVTLRFSGHLLMTEAPDATLDALIGFI